MMIATQEKSGHDRTPDTAAHGHVFQFQRQTRNLAKLLCTALVLLLCRHPAGGPQPGRTAVSPGLDDLNASLSHPSSAAGEYARPVLFHPDTMNEIESADPGEGINLIAPPEPNNQGDARLSYPIELPPGRRGIQPELSIRYDSSRGNGWVGTGWDLSVGEVTIDTRWGVPRYEAAKETETYLLDGEQLTPVAHRGALRDRTTDAVFHKRVEGDFYRIVRHGNSPSNYWWEVTHKDGTQYLYGWQPASNHSTLADPDSGAIFRWMLSRVRDTWGNTIHYRYDMVEDPGVAGGSVPGRQVYPSEIRYTGTGNDPGPYRVRFIRDRELPNFSALKRPDIIVNARSGFKMVTADLLKRIEISYEGQPIRRYDLEYEEGAFRKTLLRSITQLGSNGEEFHTHTFEYFDEVREANGNYTLFGAPQEWSVPDDNISLSALPGVAKASAISGNNGLGGGVHLYVGFNPTSKPGKTPSGGGKIGYSHSNTNGRLSLIDLDGDLLPDKVFEESGTFYFRRNLSGPNGPLAFDTAKQAVPTLPDILHETADTIVRTFPELHVAKFVSAMFGQSYSLAIRSAYLTDMNGDGFPDLIDNYGFTVLFNHPDANGVPTFTPNSYDTPVPIGDRVVDDTNLIDDFSWLYNLREENCPLLDSVRRWQAPYNGVVQISGPVQLIRDTGTADVTDGTTDGVRVAIQQAGTRIVPLQGEVRFIDELWSLRIQADDYTIHTPAGVQSIVVQRDDTFCFRVQSVFNGAQDRVDWDPQIEYLEILPDPFAATATRALPGDGKRRKDSRGRAKQPGAIPEAAAALPPPDSVHVDANLRDPHIYRASEDFVLAGRGATVVISTTGTVRVSGDLRKRGITSDDISLVVLQNGAPVIVRPMAWNETGQIPLDDEIDVLQDDTLEFIVRTDSPIDVTLLDWIPEVAYAGVPNAGSARPAYDVDLYPVHDLKVPLEPWVAPETGRIEVSPHLMLPLPIPPINEPFDSELVLTVKTPGALVAKRTIPIRDGLLPPPDQLQFLMDVEEGQAYFFDYSTRHAPLLDDPGLASKLTVRWVSARYVEPAASFSFTVPSDFHQPILALETFPEPFRGWSVFAYNGNGDRANQPIDETMLLTPGTDITSPSATSLLLHAMVPYTDENRWRASDESCWITSATMSSSRLGMDNIDVPQSGDYAGAHAIPIMSTAENIVGSIELLVTVSGSIGDSRAELDLIDMNGDLFPDVVGKFFIQYSTLTGGLEKLPRFVAGLGGTIRASLNAAYSFGLNGTPVLTTPTAKGDATPSGGQKARAQGSRSRGGSGGGKQGTSGEQGGADAELGFTGMLAGGESVKEFDLVDVNGDGLPDRVSLAGVALNLGYGFAPNESWTAGLFSIDRSESTRFALGGGLGFNDGNYGFGGGVTHTKEMGITAETLVDINGDGLVDHLVRTPGGFQVALLNTGAGFSAIPPLQGSRPDDIASDVDINVEGGAYFTISIGPLLVPPTPTFGYIIINPGGDFGGSMSHQERQLTDVNGDGYFDLVYSTDDGQLEVALNLTGRTNLLKKVVRPLGAEITLQYQRDGNTIDYPPSRWNLSAVQIADGHPGDGVDSLVTTYRYNDPIFEPNERESYGYRTVIEETWEGSALGSVYRTVTQTYNNNSFYNKGLLESTIVSDGAGNPFVETTNIYDIFNIHTGATLAVPNSTVATAFPRLIRTDTYYYEGQPTATKSTFRSYEYDTYGNTTVVFDAGEPGTQDDLAIMRHYFTDAPNHIVDKPDLLVVMGDTAELARTEAVVESGTGGVTQIRRLLSDGTAAVTDITYSADGNPLTITGPENHRDQRYALIYDYDADVRTYVTGIEDSFGYQSACTFDVRFGVPNILTGINNNRIAYDYDAFGRLETVRGPDQSDSDPPTIVFEYHHRAVTPWAWTKRLDHRYTDANDPLETVRFIDGLKRVIQEKRDAAVLAESAQQPEDLKIVSGRVKFDHVGRIIEEYYPTTEPVGTPGAFNDTYDDVAPTQYAYDVLDRVVRETKPSGKLFEWAFGFGPGRDGVVQFETIETDANGIQRRIYQNVRELTTAIREADRQEQEIIWTSYGYDPLNRLVSITDDMENRTAFSYDLLGRRVAVEQPDSGLTIYSYDLAGNLVVRETAKLRPQSQTITYEYEYNRLRNIGYPIWADNDVDYDYGVVGASDNSAGRIVHIQSQAGTEDRAYDRLGNVVCVVKAIDSTIPGHSSEPLETYSTVFGYDTWSRLRALVYPDGELAWYGYDSGGRRSSVAGNNNGVAFNYITRLYYDEFELPVLREAANGAVTRYTYDAVTGRLTALATAPKMGSAIQNLRYEYDAVGTVLQLRNDVPVPPPSEYGGPIQVDMAYDDFYRLVDAHASFQDTPKKTSRYDLEIQYDSVHNIAHKNQYHEIVQPRGRGNVQHGTTYDWSYVYAGTQPHTSTHIGDRTYSYDLNGNQTGWTDDRNGTRRTIEWDEENRIQSISDNGHTMRYKYDDRGTRVIKRGPQGETVYVNRYFTVRNRTVATKHVFVGEERVAAKLSPGFFNPLPPSGHPETNFVYFYHSDHVGNSTFVTDNEGELFQHVQYFPFGEVWVEETSNIQRTPYWFGSAELDEETGLQYHGSRYANPRTSKWLSTSGLLERSVDEPVSRDVFNSKKLNPYILLDLNPLKK